MTEQVSVELTEEEIQEVTMAKDDVVRERSKTIALVIRSIVRSVKGQAIEPEDIITKMTNIKNILERSRFPTYPLVAKQVYLRLIALYHPECFHFKDWADKEAEALISYKGQSRAEYVEVARAASVSEGQEFYIGERKPQALPKPKRRFWQRTPKEESEFENE